MPAYESLQVINPSGPGFLLIYFFVPLSFLWKLESIQSSVLDSKGVQEIMSVTAQHHLRSLGNSKAK